MQLTRRKLLGGIGLGALGVGGGGGLLSRSHRDYSHYTYASDGDVGDHRLRVAWYEEYNGRFQENQAGTEDAGLADTLAPDRLPSSVADAAFVTDATGPVIGVGNVMPGDRGALVVGLETVTDESFVAEPLDVWLQALVTADEENGLNGPELAAGDTTPSTGELGDELTVEVWRDGSPLGTCNGRKEFDEALEGPIVPRTPMSVAFGPSSAVASDLGVDVLTALDPGESRCIALEWDFPRETATNRSQGDSVHFAFRFGGVPAGTEGPFSTTNGERP